MIYIGYNLFNADIIADMEQDVKTILDRDESVSMMEPMLVSSTSKHRELLSDLAVELASLSAGLRRSLPEGILSALVDIVRSMNCYYSNLIEGHNTHPIDIEKALNEDFSENIVKRNLQLEAKAHVEVQKWIDCDARKDFTTIRDFLLEIHRKFCHLLPDELLWVVNEKSGERVKMVPGKLREVDVKVGRHIPPSPGAVDRFLTRFETAYSQLGKSEMIIGAAAAHHRLLWIHPFIDGNGRVVRLFSYSMLRDSLDTGGLWSIARGLARNVDSYKSHLARCDLARRNELDGRGNLSEEELVSFTQFFLVTCIDQVKFMETLMQPDRLRDRILIWAEEEKRAGTIPAKTANIIEALLYKGELNRGDIPNILGTSDRHARRIVSALVEKGILTSESTRSPLRLAFPAKLAHRWLPGLFPEK